jgi:hypothetical protein
MPGGKWDAVEFFFIRALWGGKDPIQPYTGI